MHKYFNCLVKFFGFKLRKHDNLPHSSNMKKGYSLYLLIIYVGLVSSINISSAKEELRDDYVLRKNPFLTETKCQEVKSIAGIDYCVQKSSITLNSCGH